MVNSSVISLHFGPLSNSHESIPARPMNHLLEHLFGVVCYVLE